MIVARCTPQMKTRYPFRVYCYCILININVVGRSPGVFTEGIISRYCVYSIIIFSLCVVLTLLTSAAVLGPGQIIVINIHT